MLSRDTQAIFYGLLTVLCWSTVAVAIKLTLSYIDAFQLIFYASLFSTLVLLLPIVVAQQLALFWQELRAYFLNSLITAVLNPLAYYLVLFAAYDRLPAQVAQAINYTWAIVLAVMGVVLLQQRLTRWDMLAALICYSGVFVLATEGNFTSFANTSVAGLSLALLSTLIWAYYWIRNLRDKRDRRVAMAINFTLATPLALGLCLIFSTPRINFEGFLGAIYIGLFEMGLAFLFWLQALILAKNTTRVSTLIFLSPCLSLYLIHWLLGEKIYLTTYIGLATILLGLGIQRIPAKGLSA